MATINAQNAIDAGTNPSTYAAATVTTGDSFAMGNGHNTIAVIKNGSGSSVTATLTPTALDGLNRVEANSVVTIAAGGVAYIPLRKDYDDGTGHATIVCNPVTTVTVAALTVAF